MDSETPTGNALAELRAKIAERTAGAEDQGPRVLSITTRKAYEAPPAVAVKVKRKRKPKVDQASIEMVEQLLEDLRAGTVDGFVGFTTLRETGAFDMRMQLPVGKDEPVQVAALRYVGGMELMKVDLLDIADFGLTGANGMEAGVEYVYEDGEPA